CKGVFLVVFIAGLSCLNRPRVRLRRGSLAFKYVLQAELLNPVAHLPQGYAQIQGGMRLAPIVALQRVDYLLPFPFPEQTQQPPTLFILAFVAVSEIWRQGHRIYRGLAESYDQSFYKVFQLSHVARP